jgi:hypothetical protein
MKSEIRTLVAAATSFGLLITGADARADSKQVCAAAYDKTQSLRDSGHLRDARKQAVACSAPTCSVYVTKECVHWLAEIDAMLPTVVFTAEDSAGADAVAVKVTVDGELVAAKLDGKAVPVDPGEHVLRFEMSGAEAVEQKAVIKQGEKNRKLAASFGKAPAAAPAVAPEPSGATSRGGVPLWAWVSGGVGVAALGVGAGFGVSALGAQSKLVTACGGDVGRCPTSMDGVTVPLAERRTLDRNVFLGLAAAGVVGLGVAVVGIATAPSKPSSPRTSLLLAPYGSPLGGGLALQGQF